MYQPQWSFYLRCIMSQLFPGYCNTSFHLGLNPSSYNVLNRPMTSLIYLQLFSLPYPWYWLPHCSTNTKASSFLCIGCSLPGVLLESLVVSLSSKSVWTSNLREADQGLIQLWMCSLPCSACSTIDYPGLVFFFSFAVITFYHTMWFIYL